MRFTIVQRFDAPAAAVVEAFRSEPTWHGFDDLPFVGTPSVASFVAGEPVVIETNYRVSIELPTLARAFIHPDRLTFAEITHLSASGAGTFEIVPDHYDGLLRSAGTTAVVEVASDRCERTIAGAVDVSLGWQGVMWERPVERAIVSGLEKALAAQATQLPL